MWVKMELEGMLNLKAELRKYGKRVIDEAYLPAAQEGMKMIGDDWRINLSEHRVTGHFQESIKEKVDGKGGTYVVAHIGALDADKDTAIGLNSLEYGHVNRDGTHTPPFPTGRPAIESNKNLIKNIVAGHLRRLFKQ